MISLKIFPYLPKFIASCSRKLLFAPLPQESNFASHTARCQSYESALIFRTLNSRAASSTANTSPHLLSDVEELVEKDLTFKDIEKEILPALPTTGELLRKCETPEDIFELVRVAVQSSRLWKEELPLYIRALATLKEKTGKQSGSVGDQILDPNVGAFELEQTQNILDDPHLQYLVRETLTHALHFTSNDLTHIFNNLVRLGIPLSSNVMSLLVVILQKRINDFFPEDVLRCFNTLRLLPADNPLFDSLKKGFLMHLENQAVDSVNFTRVLLASSFITQLRLLKYVAKTLGASFSLKSTLLFTCSETVRRRPRQDLYNEDEMRHILLTLTALGWQHKYLLRFAANYIRDHKGTLLKDHSHLVETCIAKLKVEDKVLLRRLRMC